MRRKEYRFAVEGEPFDAPFESLKELLRAGVIREDQFVEVEGIKQTLGEVLGEVSVTAGIETEPTVIAPMPPSRPATTAAHQAVVFRPFVVCGLVLLILFTSWVFFDPAAGHAIPSFSPVRRTCQMCSGLGKSTCPTCQGSGRQMTMVTTTQYRSTSDDIQFSIEVCMKPFRKFLCIATILITLSSSGMATPRVLQIQNGGSKPDQPGNGEATTNRLPTFQAKLTAPDPVYNSASGYAVSISLDTAAVGAPNFTQTQSFQGEVNLFTRQNGNWLPKQTLIAPDAGPNNYFGSAVALYGDTLIVGARGASPTQINQGAAYVFTRSNGNWAFQTKLIPSDPETNDAFGFSVALFGNTAIIGAPGKTISAIHQGAAYVFTRNGATWSQTSRLVAGDGAYSDQFGQSVSISANLIAVGAPGDTIANIGQGSGYVFEFRKNTGWGQVAKLIATDGFAYENLGYSISISGRTVLAGAPGVLNTAIGQGAAYVFVGGTGNSWSQSARLAAADGGAADNFGASVSLAGRNALIGSPGVDINGLNNGAAYSFKRTGQSWTFSSKIIAADTSPTDTFGFSVALNGSTAMIGSPGSSVTIYAQGAAYIYTGFTKSASTPGAFRPSNGFTYLRNSNNDGFADIQFFYGQAGDIPVSGDWNGDGTDSVGVYRNGTFYLRNNNSSGFADLQVSFGAAGDIPVVGDWDGDGIDTVGVFRNGVFFLRNTNTTGVPDITFSYGTGGDLPIAGDWDGDGIDTIGAFRPSTGFVFLRNTNTEGFADTQFFYGTTGDRPIAGDWNADGIDTVGIVRQGQWFLRNSNTPGFADLQFFYGAPTDLPICGDWDGQ